MNRDLKFVTIFPDDQYFTWQVHLWLESLKQIGLSDKAIVLIFTPRGRQVNQRFKHISDLYPETQFHYYKDEHGISTQLSKYIPILRPYTAWRFWTDFPDMGDKAVFYCDSDILFTKDFNINHLLDDDIVYCSNTNSYINASYFDRKIKDVIPEKVEEYKTIDVLAEATKIVGITREVCEKNNLHSGGTQYLFKNIDAAYWEKVMNDCVPIITYLGEINKRFFPNENKGFQKWTADMWAVLWNLWLYGHETKVVPELDFAWVHDPITKLERCTIYHNAGATANFTGEMPIFFKGKYHLGSSPFTDPHLDVILSNPDSMKRCTGYYASKIDELRKKYQIKYI